MLRGIARLILKLGGWKTVGEIPTADKLIGIAAPHTSNWDGFWLLAYKFANDIDVHFLAKHTLCWWPLGNFLGAVGAIPVNRSVSSSTVDQVVQAFNANDRFWFALAPEGTRKYCDYWKSGFYQIAQAANVPVLLAFIDYPSRRMGLGPLLRPGRTADADLATIREFYAPFTGRRPENQGPIAFAPSDS